MGRYARGECRECEREMLLKNKGLCVSCWKKSDRLPTGRPGLPEPGGRLDDSPVTAAMLADYADLGMRLGRKWAWKLRVLRGYTEDVQQIATAAVLREFAMGHGYDRCCMKAVSDVRNAVRDGRVRTEPDPFDSGSASGHSNRLSRKGREVLFCEVVPPGGDDRRPLEEFVSSMRWVA